MFFKKLDALYAEVNGDIFTKDTPAADEKIIEHMTKGELAQIKAVVRVAFKALAKNP